MLDSWRLILNLKSLSQAHNNISHQYLSLGARRQKPFFRTFLLLVSSALVCSPFPAPFFAVVFRVSDGMGLLFCLCIRPQPLPPSRTPCSNRSSMMDRSSSTCSHRSRTHLKPKGCLSHMRLRGCRSRIHIECSNSHNNTRRCIRNPRRSISSNFR